LVCITINLYSFILYILNNFLKTNLEKNYYQGFYRRIYSVGILNTHRRAYRWT
jgi:hypothetical protein